MGQHRIKGASRGPNYKEDQAVKSSARGIHSLKLLLPGQQTKIGGKDYECVNEKGTIRRVRS
jgi:hypothetical protein